MFVTVLQVFVLACVALLLAFTLSNLLFVRRLGSYPMPKVLPPVSILVPARNEEKNIRTCIESLLAQDYPDFEIVVLDDESVDGTPAILAELAHRDPRLRIVHGEKIPPDWIGKNWACHQLSQFARHGLLLFTDADVRHAPNTLRDAIAAFEGEKAEFLSIFTHKNNVTWSERLVVPFYSNFSLFGLMPIWLGYRAHIPLFSASNGAFLLFRREAYDRIGGFLAFHNSMEDVPMVRKMSVLRMRWRMLDGTRHVQCRMYHSFRELFEGYSRAIYASLDGPPVAYVLLFLWLILVFLEPGLFLLVAAAGAAVTSLQVLLAVISIVASWVLWGILYLRFRYDVLYALLYPLTIVLAVAIAVRSMTLTLAGRTVWKGRTVVRGDESVAADKDQEASS